MANLYITSRELIKTLRISDQDLINIEKFFDSIPDDEWELLEGKDYRVVVKSSGLREYTQSGAYTIARYLETTRKQSFWELITEWVLHTKRDIRRNFVRKKILDNCSSLVKRNDQFFVSRSDTVSIFGTRSDYLTKMVEATQKSQFPLLKGQDYDDFVDDGGLHFSVSGIYKLSQTFEQHQTKRNRKEWCKDVGEVISSQVEDIVNQLHTRYKNIEKAKDKAKKRDAKTCQVTGIKANRINQIKLAAHHLYSHNEYPHLADVENNLLTVTSEVHEQFHQDFMGGTHKPCTIDDFTRFVQQYYPRSTEVIIRLEAQKRVLGEPQPFRKPHVLYLPASRVS